MKKTITKEQVVEICDFCQKETAYYSCVECKKSACFRCAYSDNMVHFKNGSDLITTYGGETKSYAYNDGFFCKEHDGTYLYDGYKRLERMIKAIEKLDAKCEELGNSLRR